MSKEEPVVFAILVGLDGKALQSAEFRIRPDTKIQPKLQIYLAKVLKNNVKSALFCKTI